MPSALGSFYAFPAVSKSTGLEEVEFCHRLLREAEVAVVPGTAFGPHGKGACAGKFFHFLRKLVEATDRMARFVDQVQRTASLSPRLGRICTCSILLSEPLVLPLLAGLMSARAVCLTAWLVREFRLCTIALELPAMWW